MGRPSGYTDEIAGLILARMINGETLTAICAEDEMPTLSAVYRWSWHRPEFRSALDHARTARSHTLAEQTIDVAATEKDPQRARNMILARQWLAKVTNRQAYGDQVDVTVTERPSLRAAIDAANERIGRPVSDQLPDNTNQVLDLIAKVPDYTSDKESQEQNQEPAPDPAKLLDLDNY